MSNPDLNTTASRRRLAYEVHARREGGEPWSKIMDELDISESTGRKLLTEVEDVVALEAEADNVTSLRDVAAAAASEETVDEPTETPKPKEASASAGRSGRYLKLSCSCGHIIRTSKTVASSATVRCDDCGEAFAETD